MLRFAIQYREGCAVSRDGYRVYDNQTGRYSIASWESSAIAQHVANRLNNGQEDITVFHFHSKGIA